LPIAIFKLPIHIHHYFSFWQTERLRFVGTSFFLVGTSLSKDLMAIAGEALKSNITAVLVAIDRGFEAETLFLSQIWLRG
jgi:hypothetical protein